MKSIKEIEDQEIISKLRDKASENEALSLFQLKYAKKLYHHIRNILIVHEDSDEVLQLTIIKVWQNIYKFREDSGFFTWVYRIATNEALNHLRKKKTKFFLPIADYENVLISKLENPAVFNGDIIERKLRQAVLKLPEKQRLVFQLKYFEDLKYEEISKILDQSEGGLKATYHHAVKKIEKYLAND